jgi:SET domain-containing protein
MLLIKTKIDKSLIAGIGLFADQDIQKNSIVWKMYPLSVFKINVDDYHKLSKVEQDFIDNKDYYWLDKNNNYMIPIDDSRFINHSINPNIIDLDDNTCISSRDIKNGEELTIDYKTLVNKENWQNYYLH